MIIHATVAGYAGGAGATVRSFYDESDDVLLVLEAVPQRLDREGADIVVTNLPQIERDSLFQESDLQDAIKAFFQAKSELSANGETQRFIIDESVPQTVNPDGYIERDGMDANGWKFRLEEIPNGAVAVLVSVWFANRTRLVDRALNFNNELAQALASGQGITI